MRANVLISLNLPFAKPPQRDEFDEKMAQLLLEKLSNISTTWKGVAEADDAALFARELAKKIQKAATELKLNVAGILQVGNVQLKFSNTLEIVKGIAKRLRRKGPPLTLGRPFMNYKSLKK